MARIEDLSLAISDIITVIDEMACQTNLLALTRRWRRRVPVRRAAVCGGGAEVRSRRTFVAGREGHQGSDRQFSGQVGEGVRLSTRRVPC